MKLVMFLLCLLPAQAPAPEGRPQDPRLLFLKGNEALERRDFAAAVEAYEAALATGVESGEIHYNLGSAYLRAGRPGPAILALRRAAQLLPRDPEVAANLASARAEAVDHIPRDEPAPIVRTLLWFHFATTPREARNVFLVLFVAALLILHARILVRRATLGRVAAVLMALALLAGLSLALRLTLAAPPPEGVILPAEVVVRSGPSPDYAEHFRLHEGAEIRLEEARGVWWKIDVGGRKGWLPAAAVGRIG